MRVMRSPPFSADKPLPRSLDRVSDTFKRGNGRW